MHDGQSVGRCVAGLLVPCLRRRVRGVFVPTNRVGLEDAWRLLIGRGGHEGFLFACVLLPGDFREEKSNAGFRRACCGVANRVEEQTCARYDSWILWVTSKGCAILLGYYS